MDCADHIDATEFLADVRSGGRCTIVARFGAVTTASKLARALLLVVNHICIDVIRVIRGQILLLLFFAEFLESGISAQRIPERIEPEKSWRNGRPPSIRGIGRL